MNPFGEEEYRLMETSQFGKMVIATALTKMFKSTGTFSICLVREMLEELNVPFPKDEENRLRMLHCMDWSEMDPALRDEIYARIMCLATQAPMVEYGKDDFLRVLGGPSPKNNVLADKVHRMIAGAQPIDAIDV